MKVGSSLDSQIWYEPYHANEFKLFMKTDLFKSFLMNECKVCNVFWCLMSELSELTWKGQRAEGKSLRITFQRDKTRAGVEGGKQ